MTNEQRQELKRRRAATIAGYVETIASAYHVPPLWLVTEGGRHGTAAADARNLLAYHLRTQGMTFVTISRIVRRSMDTVRNMCKRGEDTLMSGDRELLDSLPSLETEPNPLAPSTSQK